MKIFRFILDLISIILFGIVDILYCISILISETITIKNGVILFALGIIVTHVIILLGKDIANILQLGNDEDNE